MRARRSRGCGRLEPATRCSSGDREHQKRERVRSRFLQHAKRGELAGRIQNSASCIEIEAAEADGDKRCHRLPGPSARTERTDPKHSTHPLWCRASHARTSGSLKDALARIRRPRNGKPTSPEGTPACWSCPSVFCAPFRGRRTCAHDVQRMMVPASGFDCEQWPPMHSVPSPAQQSLVVEQVSYSCAQVLAGGFRHCRAPPSPA